MAEHLRDCGIKPSAILLEPVGRNTAPAAAIAALLIAETNEDALILLLPSDHIIKDQDEFLGPSTSYSCRPNRLSSYLWHTGHYARDWLWLH